MWWEREKNLGGNLLRHYTTLSGEDHHARVAHLVSAAGSHPKIGIHTGAELSGVSGYMGNFQVGIASCGSTEMVEVGAIIVATGGMEYSPEGYLYGEDLRVLTQGELERVLHEEGMEGDTVVMIQCVGSRSEERPYCSRVCCRWAIKNASSSRRRNRGPKWWWCFTGTSWPAASRRIITGITGAPGRSGHFSSATGRRSRRLRERRGTA